VPAQQVLSELNELAQSRLRLFYDEINRINADVTARMNPAAPKAKASQQVVAEAPEEDVDGDESPPRSDVRGRRQ
jgi:hypothetical protein